MMKTMTPSMNLTKKQLYDMCMTYADINAMDKEFINGVQARAAEKQKLNDDLQQTQATLIAEQKYQLDKLTATLEAQKGANARWAADYKQLQEHIAGWRRAHQEQTMDTDDANWKTKRMFGVVDELKTRVQQLTNEAAERMKTVKTLTQVNKNLHKELDEVKRQRSDMFTQNIMVDNALTAKLWDNHVDVMVALAIDNGELIDYYINCCTDGRYELREGEAGAKWVHAAGISGDRLYDHYVRWCWKHHGRGATLMKEDFVMWMRARCTANPLRDADGTPLPPASHGLMYGEQALGRDWKVPDRLIPLDVTVPEYFDLPAPPAWAYACGDSDDEFESCSETAPASPGSDDDDLDVVVADIEDKQVSARAMRLKKRNMKKRKKARR